MAPYNKLVKESGELFRVGRLKEAEQKCRQAIAADPFPGLGSSITRDLADIQLARRDYKGALESYGVNRPKSMRHIPGYPELCMRIAQCYVGLGNLAQARKFYNYTTARWSSASLQKLPGAGSLRSIEASLLLMRAEEVGGWPEQALRYYQAAGKLAPKNWWIAEQTGDTLYRLKRYDEAIPYYRLVIQQRGAEASYRTRTSVEMYDRQHGHPHPPQRF